MAKKFTLGYIGLGKMGLNMVYNMLEQGHKVVVYNRSKAPMQKAKRKGAITSESINDLVSKLPNNKKKIIWIMLPAGKVTTKTIKTLAPILNKGDIVIDGGNSFYQDSKKAAKFLAKKKINFIDIGVSGGPKGARNGSCMMVGGKKQNFNYIKPLLQSICVKQGLEHFEGAGAGHYVKMVHNGIEYGIMESIAEGFHVLHCSKYKLNLEKVASVYNNGSVIESKLMSWMLSGLKKYGRNLKDVSGSAGQGGKSAGRTVKAEANWTVYAAKQMNIHSHAIKAAIKERQESRTKPSFRGKIINTLRNEFGGHKLEKTSKKKTKTKR